MAAEIEELRRLMSQKAASLPVDSRHRRFLETQADNFGFFLTKDQEESQNLQEETFSQLSIAREPSAEERQILEKKGFTFFRIEAKSIRQVAAERPDYFQSNGTLNGLSDYIPLKNFELAIPTRNPDLPGSYKRISFKAKLRIVREYSKEVIRPLVPRSEAIIPPATALAQVAMQSYMHNLGGLSTTTVLDKTTVDEKMAALEFENTTDLKMEINYTASDGSTYPFQYLHPVVIFI